METLKELYLKNALKARASDDKFAYSFWCKRLKEATTLEEQRG